MRPWVRALPTACQWITWEVGASSCRTVQLQNMPGAPIECINTPVRGDGNILEMHERTHTTPASQEPSRGRHLDDALVACIGHVHVAGTVDRDRNGLPQPENARS